MPSRQDEASTEGSNDPLDTSALPDMFALDGYGIPWFYHMYPVPWLFPPMFAKGRSKSPRKLRSKKQRGAVTSPANGQQASQNALRTDEANAVKSGEDVPVGDGFPAASVGNVSAPNATINIKSSDGPFSTQFDIIARQAALQPSTNTQHAPRVDLTTLRNVPVSTEHFQGQIQGFNTVSAQRRSHRQTGNGLYGGRGNVGIPLYATVPFPSPLPPMGRPTEGFHSGPKAYVEYTVGANACGTVEIEKAAEHGGAQACNTCEPDHRILSGGTLR